MPDYESRLTRRRLLYAGASGAAVAALGASQPVSAAARGSRNLIFILCTGGPSQLDTWDPKPDAPAQVRGPYRAIPTNVAGIRVSETLPRLARLADHYALIRSVHGEGPALHELGMQAIQTGAAFGNGPERPHYGASLAATRAHSGEGYVVLPRPLGFTGLDLPHGQHAGALGARFDPYAAAGDPNANDFSLAGAVAHRYRCDEPRAARRQALNETFGARLVANVEPEPTTAPTVLREAYDLSGETGAVRDRYGRTTFGQSCLLARRLIERDVRAVTLNQFSGLFHQRTWDCHGYPDLPTRVADLKDEVAAPFDQAVSALIEDLSQRGLYDETLLCCFGEFGRTPEITATGGRDHWNRCWSVMMGGGGVRGGQVIGASDRTASEPTERPVSIAELGATVQSALGLPAEPGTKPVRTLLG